MNPTQIIADQMNAPRIQGNGKKALPQITAAAIMFIDNSHTSINGGFSTTRLVAQKQTIEKFYDYYKKKTAFGFGGMAEGDFGLKASFDKGKNETFKSLSIIDLIKAGGKINLEKALRCGILAMNQRPKKAIDQKLIFLIASQHNLTKEAADEIANIAREKKISINFFIFGNERIDEEPLIYLINKMGSDSHLDIISTGPIDLATSIHNQYLNNFPE